MASLTPESRNTVKPQQLYYMNGDECSGICLFNVTVSKSQVDIWSTITLLLEKLKTRMPSLMVSFGNNITDFNKDIIFVGTSICAHEEETDNLFTQILSTYAECISDNGPLTRYSEMLEKQ